MEVEAKFRIPAGRTFQQLLEATGLAVFGLEGPRMAAPHDCCLDTADDLFRAGGYPCRIRWQDGQTSATFKGLGAVSGAAHHRAAQHGVLPETLSPQDWPQRAARDLALHPGSGESLYSLTGDPSNTPSTDTAAGAGSSPSDAKPLLSFDRSGTVG